MIDYWLLNTAIEFGIPLAYLFPEVSQAINVKPLPGVTSQNYAEGLLDLFDRHLITFSSHVPGNEVENRSGLARILERFLAIPNDQGGLPYYRRHRLPGMQVAFKLTPLGGKTWEGVADPDWTRYVSVSTISTSGDLISADRDLLIAYMGWYPQIRGEKIALHTVRWQTHTDFEIVYWKRLPLVQHASFTVDPTESRWLDGQPQWFLNWRISNFSWHKQPWHLPDWPSQ